MLVLTWHDIVARWFTTSKVRARDGTELGQKWWPPARGRATPTTTATQALLSSAMACHKY